jgi:hypothetical protein
MNLEVRVSTTHRRACIHWYKIISGSVENELLKGDRL